LIYVLRTVNPVPLQELWNRFDDITRQALEEILSGPLTQQAWAQANLPTTLGGLGLRRAGDHAAAAYTAAVHQSMDTIRLITKNPDLPALSIPRELLQQLSTALGESQEQDQEVFAHFSQKYLSLVIDQRNLHLLQTRVLNSGDLPDSYRFMSVQKIHSGD